MAREEEGSGGTQRGRHKKAMGVTNIMGIWGRDEM